MNNIDLIFFIAFSIFLGIEIISNVPAILHTPLMSGSNAISGIILLGGIITMSQVDPNDDLNLLLGAIAVFLGTLNVAGGFFVTSRMLKMFKTKN